MVSDLAERTRRFDDAGVFFLKRGSVWMKLTKDAAAVTIDQCTQKDIAVSIIEGGIWREPGFEARLDAIWHSDFDTKPELAAIESNNSKALAFIRNKLPTEIDTVIISTFENEHE